MGEEMAKHKGNPQFYWIMTASNVNAMRGRAASAILFLVRAIQDHANYFERRESAADHFVEPRRIFFDALGELGRLDHDGQVLRQAKNFFGMINT